MIYALAITGPTASGKTSLSLDIAKALGCEIISCDSMQIYRGMDIGTAKANAEERASVPHHMIDILDPGEQFSAKAYRNMAMECVKRIAERGKIPLFVGGTGLYLATVMRSECEEAPESDPNYRKHIEDVLVTEDDKLRLWERLNKVDPISANLIHYNNTRRVIRALEIFDATGKPKSYFDALSQLPNSEIKVIHITLGFHERINLYNRTDARVHAMIESGLIEEIDALLEAGLLKDDSTAAQAIGYKEIIRAKLGLVSLAQAIEELKQATRNYAKRQLTWFRHDESAQRVYVDNENGDMRCSEEVFAECLGIFKSALSENI